MVSMDAASKTGVSAKRASTKRTTSRQPTSKPTKASARVGTSKTRG
jgi:hypothetical protein